MNLGWFSTSYDYSGQAEVTFDNPRAVFYGPATVGPDEHGQPSIEVKVERSDPTISDGFDLAEIQLGSLTHADGVKVITLGGGARNRATAKVLSKRGNFTGDPSWEYGFSDYFPDAPLKLRLKPMKSEYAANAATHEKFMVLPLFNFVTSFPRSAEIIRQHPLCVTPDAGNEFTGCVTFQVEGELAFIQQLQRSSDGIVGIKPWTGERVLTSLAVIPITDTAMTDPWGEFVGLFLGLLDLACGRHVRTPWIELRDQAGKLIRRSHFPTSTDENSTEGYQAIELPIHWQNGEFLTDALSSVDARERSFSVALRHCASAGLPGLTLDGRLVHLVRAYECLCKHYGFSTQDLTEGFAAGTKSAIKGALSAASASIKTLTNPSDPARAQVSRIVERVRSAAQVERDFGLAVKAISDHFGLLDFSVLQPYYATNPGPGGRDWLELLSYYRGAVLHEGYIDFESPGTPVGEMLGFIFHLHDLLVRILLKIIKYRGMYQPRSIRFTGANTTDWVRPGINVDALLNVPTLSIRRP